MIPVIAKVVVVAFVVNNTGRVDVAVVDVASMLPTVSCVPVAINAPLLLVVMIEFGARFVANEARLRHEPDRE